MPTESQHCKRCYHDLRAHPASCPLYASPDPRPTDLAELARLVAIELRKRGIWCAVSQHLHAAVITTSFEGTPIDERRARSTSHILDRPRFDNLGPIACAGIIQQEEARYAREWAGDP
jgi:hypothetical protein